jgi:hypothetical protein
MFCRRFKPYVSTLPPRLQRCASLFQRRCYSLPPHTDPQEDLFAALTADQLVTSLQEMGASPALLEFLRCEGWNGFHLKGICPKFLSVITLPDHGTSSVLLMRLVRDLRRREKEAEARGKTVNICLDDSETVVETFLHGNGVRQLDAKPRYAQAGQQRWHSGGLVPSAHTGGELHRRNGSRASMA